MRKSPLRFLARVVENIFRIRLNGRPNPKLVKPLMASLYLTMKCNFRCTYCDDGSGLMYPEIPEKDRMELTETLAVLDMLDAASPGLNITGGEPTLHPHIEEIFAHIGRLRFSPVVLDTNAFLLDKHLSILHHLDYLAVSLDSVNEERSDALINLGNGKQTERVLRNLEVATDYRRKHNLKFEIVLLTVIFPETIDDAWDVMAYALENGHTWAPMPHIHKLYPHPGLIANPRWEHLIDECIRLQKSGEHIFGNPKMLEKFRNFERFECYPTLRATIYPNGDFCYPCAPLGTKVKNILDYDSLQAAVDAGYEMHGSIPSCDSRCHLTCYLAPSSAISYPKKGALFTAIRYYTSPWKKPKAFEKPPRAPNLALPPSYDAIRAMPSLPPDEIRTLRSQGRVEKDFTSWLRIQKEVQSAPALPHRITN